jgi:integrase
MLDVAAITQRTCLSAWPAGGRAVRSSMAPSRAYRRPPARPPQQARNRPASIRSRVTKIRALRRLQREQPPGPHVFTSERGGPMTPKSFHALIARLGERAGMPFPIHPHMLRHACGFALANAGHDTRALQAWLGHRNIQHTVRYTELSPRTGSRISGANERPYPRAGGKTDNLLPG